MEEIQHLSETVSPETSTNTPKPILDLSGLEPPESLTEERMEEITIDGICGVY